MKKILFGAAAFLLLCTMTGCNVKHIPAETPSPSPAELSEGLKPVGAYVEGMFTKVEDGKLYVDEAGKERVFILSPRAENDMKVLGIGPENQIVVNIGRPEDGTPVAESLEKIIVE